MAEVFVDGVKVELEGHSPATADAVRALLESALAENGRVLAAFVVDGHDADASLLETAFNAVQRIDISSVTQAEAIRSIAQTAEADATALLEQIDMVARTVLREPWPSCQQACVGLVGAIGAVLENSATIASFEPSDANPVKTGADRLVAALEEWLPSVERGDAASACLGLDRLVHPGLDELRRALRGVGAGPE